MVTAYATAASTQHVVNPIARLDRLRTTRHHLLWILLLGLGCFLETFDNMVFGYLAPSIRAQWGLSIAQVGVISSAAFPGMMIGALLGGRLSDQFGRKPTLVGATVLYSAASLLCALAPTTGVLFVGRFLTGIGVQATICTVLVYTSEMFPRLSRGRFFTTLIFCAAVAIPVTGFTAAAIAPSSAGAWRWVFALGSTGLVIAIAIAVLLPETVRWLTMNNRENEGEAIVEKLEEQDRRRGELAPVLPIPAEVKHGTFRELFKPRYAKRLVVFTLAFSGSCFAQYGFQAWVPTILVGSGMSHSLALHTASVISLGTLLGSPALFFVSDRIERKTAILLGALLTGGAYAAFALANNPTAVIISGAIAFMGLTALVTSFYNIIPEVFPTEVRGVATGVVNGVCRLAGIASSLVGASMYENLGTGPMFLILGASVALAGTLVFVFGPRTTGCSLEHISAEPPEAMTCAIGHPPHVERR
ncbi:MFS transporter [Paraburkholderia sp. RL17-347-BIC-D]|uniref:MFS transporter n=1 Tax=Paraburkholderia sp. RL17-347-BIC-D TaxID=3031632 RepID=UPI0038B717D0